MLRLVGGHGKPCCTWDASYHVIASVAAADATTLVGGDVHVVIHADDRWLVQITRDGDGQCLTLSGDAQTNPAWLMREVIHALLGIVTTPLRSVAT